MARIGGGARVGAGFYWRAAEWQVVTLPRAGGTLPGDARETFYRIPVLAMPLLAPVMGGLFVMFLPLVGFVLVLQHAASGALPSARRAARWLGARFPVPWRPARRSVRSSGSLPKSQRP